MTPLDVDNVLAIRADMIKALMQLENLLIENGRLSQTERAVMSRRDRRQLLQDAQQLNVGNESPAATD
jgi:hypothetical protein